MPSYVSLPPSGHVFRREGQRGGVWYAKYRLPDGRQVQRRIGPAWSQRGRPAAGHYTKHTAEQWLADLLQQARRGELPGMVHTGATFADAAAEYLRWIEHDRQRKPSTLRGYRSIINAHLLPGVRRPNASRTSRPSRSNAGPSASPPAALNNRTRLRILTVLHGIMQRAKRVWKLPRNPVADVEKPIQARSISIEVFSPEEVMALVREADSEQDAAIYLTAAFTGLRRGELVALRWREVDFPRPAHPGRGQLQRARPLHTQVGQGPIDPDGRAGGRDLARLNRGRHSPATTTSCSPGWSAVTSTAPRCTAATRRRSSVPGCAGCGSTTSATPSARRSSATRRCRSCS